MYWFYVSILVVVRVGVVGFVFVVWVLGVEVIVVFFVIMVGLGFWELMVVGGRVFLCFIIVLVLGFGKVLFFENRDKWRIVSFMKDFGVWLWL